MKRKDFKKLANMFSKQLEQLKTIPGFLTLDFCGLSTTENKISLQLYPEKFMEAFPPETVQIKVKKSSDKIWYHARIALGNLTITCVMDVNEYKQYFSEADKHTA